MTLWHQYENVVRKNKKTMLEMQKKKTKLLNLHTKGKFTNEEMLEYVQRLYMHEGVLESE